jgi:hypothetical protein
LIRASIASIALFLIVISAIAIFSGSAHEQSVQILSYSPGNAITYTGHGTPGSTVTLQVSSSITVPVSGGTYQLQFSDLNIPACSVTISAHPVKTISFGSKQWVEVPLIGGGYTPEITKGPLTPSGTTGSYTYNAGGGKYCVRVFGEAAAGVGSVVADVSVSQQVSVNGNGAYTQTINTAGLPAGVYYLRQDGTTVAEIYLGVSAPMSYTLNLRQGWNLISLPIQPRNSQISSIFSEAQQSNIDVIWDYNGGNWLYWTTEEPWNQNNPLKSLDPLTGYYIYCYNPMSVTVYGSSPPSPKSWNQLVQGWNLVGYPSTSSTRVDSLYGPADVVWKYDSGNWYYYTTEPDYANRSTLSTLGPGYGYWVYKL